MNNEYAQLLTKTTHGNYNRTQKNTKEKQKINDMQNNWKHVDNCMLLL